MRSTGMFICKKGYNDEIKYFTIRKGRVYFCILDDNYITVVNQYNIEGIFIKENFYKYFYTSQEYNILLRNKKLKMIKHDKCR